MPVFPRYSLVTSVDVQPVPSTPSLPSAPLVPSLPSIPLVPLYRIPTESPPHINLCASILSKGIMEQEVPSLPSTPFVPLTPSSPAWPSSPSVPFVPLEPLKTTPMESPPQIILMPLLSRSDSVLQLKFAISLFVELGSFFEGAVVS